MSNPSQSTYITTVATSPNGHFLTAPTGDNNPLVGGAANKYRITDSHVGSDREQQDIQNKDAQAILDAEIMARAPLENWSWGFTAWNIIALVLCPGCLWCMFTALLFNMFAYVDHRRRDYKHKMRKLRWAIGLSVGAFIGGIVAIVIIIIVLYVRYDANSWNSIPTIPGSDYFM